MSGQKRTLLRILRTGIALFALANILLFFFIFLGRSFQNASLRDKSSDKSDVVEVGQEKKKEVPSSSLLPEEIKNYEFEPSPEDIKISENLEFLEEIEDFCPESIEIEENPFEEPFENPLSEYWLPDICSQVQQRFQSDIQKAEQDIQDNLAMGSSKEARRIEPPDAPLSQGIVFKEILNIAVADIKHYEDRLDIWLVIKIIGKSEDNDIFPVSFLITAVDDRENKYRSSFTIGRNNFWDFSPRPRDIKSLPIGFIWTKIVPVRNVPKMAPISKILIKRDTAFLDEKEFVLNPQHCCFPDFKLPHLEDRYMILENEVREIDKNFSYFIGRLQVQATKEKKSGRNGVCVFVPVIIENRDYNDRSAPFFKIGVRLNNGVFLCLNQYFNPRTQEVEEHRGLWIGEEERKIKGLSRRTIYPAIFYCPFVDDSDLRVWIEDIILYRERQEGSFLEDKALFCGFLSFPADFTDKFSQELEKAKKSPSVRRR